MNNLNVNSPRPVNQEEINFSTNHMDLIKTGAIIANIRFYLGTQYYSLRGSTCYAVFQPYHHKAQYLVCCMTLNALHTWIHVGLYIYLGF